MFHERKPAHLVTPEYEDRGIFKKDIVQLTVQAIAQFGQNARGDVIVKAFVAENGVIDLIFPGRRKQHAAILQEHIQTQWKTAAARARKRNEKLDVEDFRCHIQVEGSWRPRFGRDDQGLQTRNHQLYAARWAYRDHDGITVFSGEPVVR